MPSYMCEKLYNAKTKGLKQIFLVDNASHAESIIVNKELYSRKISDFIQNALNDTDKYIC